MWLLELHWHGGVVLPRETRVVYTHTRGEANVDPDVKASAHLDHLMRNLYLIKLPGFLFFLLEGLA